LNVSRDFLTKSIVAYVEIVFSIWDWSDRAAILARGRLFHILKKGRKVASKLEIIMPPYWANSGALNRCNTDKKAADIQRLWETKR